MTRPSPSQGSGSRFQPYQSLPFGTRPALSIGVQVVALATLLLAIVFFQTPSGGEYFSVLQKAGHSAAFAIIAALVFWGLRTGRRPRRADYPIAFATAVALGALTELAQGFVQRDSSTLDVCRDALGAAAALTALLWLESKWTPAAVLCCLAAGVIGAPIAICLAAYTNRDLQFPTLWKFNSALDLYFAVGRGGFQPVQIPAARSGGPRESALFVPFVAGASPGLNLSEPFPDWRGYSNLMLDLSNPTVGPMQITVRVNDRDHNQDFADRFNRDLRVAARTRAVIRIPLLDVEGAPHGRRMDMRHIARVAVFHGGDHGEGGVILTRIWLE